MATYTLTEKGQNANPRPGTDRSVAHYIVRRYAGKPNGLENAKAEIDRRGFKTVVGNNHFSWLVREGMIRVG